MLKKLKLPLLIAVVLFVAFVVFKNTSLFFLVGGLLPAVSWAFCKQLLISPKRKLLFVLCNSIFSVILFFINCRINPFNTPIKEFLLPSALLLAWILFWSLIFVLGKSGETANIIKLNSLIFSGAFCEVLYQEFFLMVDFLGPADFWCIILLPYSIAHFFLAERFAKDKWIAHLTLFSTGFLFFIFLVFLKYFSFI